MSPPGVAPPARDAAAPRSRRDVVAVAVVAVAAFLACLRRINGLDYWTHLALGRAMSTLGTLYVGEPFVARPGAPGPTPMTARGWLDALTVSSEWPFQVGTYALQHAAGHGAVSAAIALCGAAAATILVGALLRRASAPTLAIGAAAASAAFYVARFRFDPRPEAPAAVLLAVVLVLALRWTEHPRWLPLAGVAAVLVLWRPLHVTWTLGAALAGAAIAAGPWLAFWRRQHLAVRVVSAGIAAAGAVAAARFALFVVRELGSGGLLAEVTEMRPTWEFESVLVPFAAWAIAALALAWGGRGGRAPRLALWAVAAAIGLVVVRNAAFAAIAMLAAALAGLGSSPERPLRAASPRAVVAASALAMAALLAVELRDRDYPLGVGVDFRLLPREAALFVAERLDAPVFNSWDWGGYLAWAWAGRPRTFLDGRLFDRETMAEHDEVVSGEGDAVIARRGFRTIVLQPMFRNSGRLVPGLARLLGSVEWKLVHARDALVFARAPLPPGVAEVPEGEAWRVVLRQAEALKEQNDPPLHADFSRAIAFLRLGQPAAAREAYLAAWRAAPALETQYPGLDRAVGAR